MFSDLSQETVAFHWTNMRLEKTAVSSVLNKISLKLKLVGKGGVRRLIKQFRPDCVKAANGSKFYSLKAAPCVPFGVKSAGKKMCQLAFLRWSRECQKFVPCWYWSIEKGHIISMFEILISIAVKLRVISKLSTYEVLDIQVCVHISESDLNFSTVSNV